ncbi:MAG: PEGA domain-containing protein [Myxococcota bacterium]
MCRCAGLLFVLLISTTSSAQDGLPRGVVVTVGPVDPAGVMRGASEAEAVNWELRRLDPQATPALEAPTEAIARLRDAFEGAEFDACLAAAQGRELGVDALLARGDRESAADVLAFAASCAHHATNEDVSRELLARAVAAELPLAGHSAFQDVAVDRAFRELERAATVVTLRLSTDPEGAAISVDGRPRACPESPCTIALRPGRHVITAAQVGYRVRELVIDVLENEERSLSLDEAPSQLVEAQLSATLADGTAPDDPAMVNALSIAYSTPLLLVGWSEDPTRLALFDLGDERLVLREGASGGELEGASDRLVRRWVGEQPRPLWKKPGFWVVSTLILAAAVGGTVAAFALQPGPQFNIVGR